jgi:hypothetical protein
LCLGGNERGHAAADDTQQTGKQYWRTPHVVPFRIGMNQIVGAEDFKAITVQPALWTATYLCARGSL